MNFFNNLAISGLIINLYGLQVSMSLRTYRSIKLGIECTNFFYQILCLQMSILIIHGYCFHVSYARAQLKRKTHLHQTKRSIAFRRIFRTPEGCRNKEHL